MNQPGIIAPRLLQSEFMALKPCKHGLFLYNVNDTFIGRSLDLYGEWCEQEIDVLSQIAQPGHVVLDIGANIGTHTVGLAKKLMPNGIVYAFEPQRLIFQNLCANVALNGLMNVIVKQVGVGNIAQQIPLPTIDPRQEVNFGAIKIEGFSKGEAVEIIRIDDLKLNRCDLMKIDVEGMESRVLQGARETIARFKPVLFIENDTVERSREVLEAIFALDYVGYWQIANYYNPRNYFGNPENIFANYMPQSNVLCFHKGRPAQIVGLEPIAGPEDNWRAALERIAQRRAAT